jgi:hypothetical protein
MSELIQLHIGKSTNRMRSNITLISVEVMQILAKICQVRKAAYSWPAVN